jgi:hypothetical protein
MNSRERLQATLDHQQPDRVCVDFGATFVTGIHVAVVDRMRRALLGDDDYHVKVNEPYQMLGEVDDQLREVVGVDVIGRLPRKSIFGTDEDDFKPFTLYDGTEVLVPHNFNTTVEESTGDTLIYPEGDTSVPPSGRMPSGGWFFDSIIRQEPIVEDKLDPADNLEEFSPFGEEDLAYYRQVRQWFEDRSECGALVVVPGTAFGDIALVPAPFLKHPKGIRDIEQWYMSIALRGDYVKKVFDKQCEIGLANIEQLIDILGDTVQVALITGTDFGTQRGLFCSVETYRDLFKPYHVAVNRLIHEKSNWKTFIHSCGSIRDLIPDLIDAGFDILNPVQCSAAKMDARELKKEFGRDVVFWGGGVDTQQTLPFGTPDEVYDEVRERIEIFNDGGGFVFNTIHNIQGDTKLENVDAMLKGIRDSYS